MLTHIIQYIIKKGGRGGEKRKGKEAEKRKAKKRGKGKRGEGGISVNAPPMSCYKLIPCYTFVSWVTTPQANFTPWFHISSTLHRIVSWEYISYILLYVQEVVTLQKKIINIFAS